MDVERTMQFILDQQANFWASLNRLEGVVGRVATLCEGLVEVQRRAEERMDGFEERMNRMAEHMEKTDHRLDRMSELVLEIEDKLNGLIKFVDSTYRHPPQQA